MITAALINKVHGSTIKNRDVLKIIDIVNRVKKTKKKLEVNVVIVGGREIRTINRIYRKKDEVTDVLSFSYDHEHGEIFICNSQVKNPSDFSKLLVHGIFHILGYDHTNNLKAKKMEKQEQIILSHDV